MNNTLNAALRERRESKKRSREGQPADPSVVGEVHVPQGHEEQVIADRVLL